MNVLVVYATKSGSTGEIADWIADGVRTAGHHVTVAAADEAPGPEQYDVVFAGSGIRAGKWHTAATDWLANHADALRTRPLVTFTGSLAVADTAPETVAEVSGYTTKVIEPLNLMPVAHGSLVGAYDPAKMTMPERIIMRALRRNTASDERDPEAVRVWARQVMQSLAPVG